MLLLLALLFAAAGGDAATQVVSVERPGGPDPLLAETALRIRAELATTGLQSRIVSCDVDPKAGPADCARDGTQASISLARADEVTSIFVSSRLKSGLELRRQVRVRSDDGGADATLLAVRAVELLRDLQVEAAAAAADDPEEPKPLEPFAQPATPGPPRWHLVAGAATLMIPWTGKRGLDPAVGAVLGIGAQFGPHLLAIFEAAGPFAASLPVARDNGDSTYSDRSVFQAIARVSVRFSRGSAVEGPFAAPFVGLTYIHLSLDAPNLTGSGQTLAPLVGFGLGYSTRLLESVLLTAEVDVDEAPDIQVPDVQNHVLAESGHLWMTFNVSATLPLF